MRVHVTFSVFETVVGDQIPAVRNEFGGLIGKLMDSGKLVAHGVFADGRAGFLVLNVENSNQLMNLLYPLHDFAKIETHPFMSFKELGEFFERNPA